MFSIAVVPRPVLAAPPVNGVPGPTVGLAGGASPNIILVPIAVGRPTQLVASSAGKPNPTTPLPIEEPIPVGNDTGGSTMNTSPMHKTLGRGHYTIELPQPVTPEVAAHFNALFQWLNQAE